MKQHRDEENTDDTIDDTVRSAPIYNLVSFMTASRFEQEALPQMRALQNFALQLCKDEQYSQDLTQETMLKAYTYFHTYREGTNCRAWLFQICKNSYINEVRKRQHQPVAVDLQGEESGDRSHRDNDTVREQHVRLDDRHAANTVTDALGDEVYRALAVLPSDYQTVLILCDIEGHTYDEIAEYLHAPVGTIRSRIHRGRKLLARRLTPYARSQGFAHQPGVRTTEQGSSHGRIGAGLRRGTQVISELKGIDC